MASDPQIQYTPLPDRCYNDDGRMYTVTSSQFPSHIRSIQPKHDAHIAMVTDVVDKETSRVSRRRMYVLLVAIFIISASTAVALTVHEIRRIMGPQDQSFPATDKRIHILSHNVTVERNDPGIKEDSSNNSFKDRTPCIKTCSTFADRKFNSSCHHRYCECRGDNYQKQTCFPSVNGCVITRALDSETASAYMASDAVPVHTCENNATPEILMTVAVYGNHFSDETIVNLTESTGKSLRVVLSSHFPVRWKLVENNNIIRSIHVICSKSFPKLEALMLEERFKAANRVPPNIVFSQAPTGYGDDRGESNTVAMIRMIDSYIGPITSFTGAKYANYVTVNVSKI